MSSFAKDIIMRKNIFILFLFLQITLFAQNTATITGYVYDNETGETIIGANIFAENTQKGTTTNSYGYYSLTLKSGNNYNISYAFIGYLQEKINVKLSKDTIINIYLQMTDNQLDEIVVSANSKIKSNEYSSLQLTPLSMRRLPSIFGENDPVKTIQLQTGIKTIGEGTSGFYVQGGNIDQNLILIDEAPIYNPSHLFGLVSVFNPDAVKEIKFYKGNISAKYGGRLSSVMDVKMNEGNMNKLQLSGGVSLLASRLTLQGPLIKNKASFLITGRRSFIDFFMQPNDNESIIPQFYDFNFKTNFKLNHKNRLFLSFYKGYDKILSVGDFTNIWGSQTLTFRYNHIFSPRIFSNISLIYSNYQNQLDFPELNQNISWTTAIKDYTLKTDFSFFISSNNKIQFGTNTVFHNFTPGQSNTELLQSISQSQALENAIYLLNDITLSDKIGINYGLRFSVFQNIGKATWYYYDKNFNPVKENRNENGIYNTYQNLQPRISINYFITKNLTLKSAYSRTIQYVQLLQNNAYAYTSLETWVPASPNILPQTADIISLGLEFVKSSKYQISFNSYYKKFNNQIDYIDHARLIGTQYIETQIRTGKANAYGLEIILQKTSGKLTGYISYNYSRIIKEIHGINNNKPYPATYDMPNDARILITYNFTKRISASAYWIYTTGRAFTMPSGYFEYEGLYVPLYSDRNAERMPDYHRLDITVNINPKKNKKFKSYWKIGIYNVYARQNPLGYNFEYDAFVNSLHIYQYNFITIMPSISYSFKF